MEAKQFGQFIAGIRKEKKMTQAELAQQIHVTDKAVSRWERGLGFPDIQTLEPLAQALGITVLELMRSEKKKQRSRINNRKNADIPRERWLKCYRMQEIFPDSRKNRIGILM